MKIVIAGSSGLVGSALVPSLMARGDEVVRLVRKTPGAPGEVRWDPARGDLPKAALEGIDGIVNLAGENIGAGRWTAERRERIRRSRVESTQTLAGTMGLLSRPPRIFVNASAVGFYGSRGDEILTEASGAGGGFLAEVCSEWERRAREVDRLGIRTVQLRFGVILSSSGGALARLLPVFRRGLGGRLGSGSQWMSWVTLADAVGAILHVIDDASYAGPVNIVTRGAVTNAEFTRCVAAALGRPAFLSVPATVLRVVLGEMAEETLLASTRAAPRKLEAGGFGFQHPGLGAALGAAMGE